MLNLIRKIQTTITILRGINRICIYALPIPEKEN